MRKKSFSETASPVSVYLKCSLACAMVYGLSTVNAQERAPNFREIIRANLEHFDAKSERGELERGSFPFTVQIISYPSVTNVQTSDVARKVTTSLYGPAWQTCIRATVGKTDRTIAVFIHEDRVIDSRSAVGIDGCETGNYVPLAIHRSAGKEHPTSQPSQPRRQSQSR